MDSTTRGQVLIPCIGSSKAGSGAEEQSKGAETKLISDWRYRTEYWSIYTKTELGMSIYSDK